MTIWLDSDSLSRKTGVESGSRQTRPCLGEPMPDSPGHAALDPGTSRAATPAWVKVFGIGIGALVLLLLLGMFAGGGHGPSRHLPTGDTPTSGVPGTSGGHMPPEGGH
ncbi:hypothetical protein AAH979_37520 [Plantactinospora sp. ZYX-F-223]|uniref:hypothetical protein n=1 Tax=Plantactinospora sp. ZYX-F-223 TaxID=3144103 RepID=UPI0031FCDE1F